MKGDGQGYGFEMISSIGAEIETLSVNQKKEEIYPLLEQLEKYLSLIEIVYQEME